MKINILTSGRYHVCDLARELDRQGFDVRFYSYVPTKRLGKFGLRQECCKSLLWIIAPFLFLERLIKCNKTQELKRYALDYIVGLVMRDCDVCVAMSGSFIYAIKKAKMKGAKVILERGSTHVLVQKEILDLVPKSKKISDFMVERELLGYEIADYISIASEHVYNSFVNKGVSPSKLFLNNYGVDLKMFHESNHMEKIYDLIMVGLWCHRKGCDLIVEALKDTHFRLLHVGNIGDLEFPEDENFIHINAVEQSKLQYYYNQAKVFLLPSREEGLALVQLQAVACNLPIIGSIKSGAVDIKKCVDNPDFIIIIESYDIDTVKNAILLALHRYEKLKEGSYSGTGINKLTWKAYGERYADFIKRISV